MLLPGKTYRDNYGRRVHIAGRVRDYSPELPYVWSFKGDWYHEQTGAFVSGFIHNGEYQKLLLPVDALRSISNHTPQEED